jgi:hypothetical protein
MVAGSASGRALLNFSQTAPDVRVSVHHYKPPMTTELSASASRMSSFAFRIDEVAMRESY